MPADDNVIQFPGASRSLTGPGFSPGLLGFDPFALRQPKLLPKRTKRVRFTVRIDLDRAKPPIWRRLRLASDLTLSQLHDIIQVAMGWTDSHLHHFIMGPGSLQRGTAPFLTPFDLEEGEQGTLEADVRLDQVLGKPKDRLYYEYDFGDGWDHTIRLEKVEPWTDGDRVATCIAGARACPPEDVGGVPGYEEALAMLAGDTEGMDTEWVAHKLDWLPDGYDPELFSVDEVNELLDTPDLPALDAWREEIGELFRRVMGPANADLTRLVARAMEGPPPSEAEVAALTHRYQHLLRTVGSGITLTGAGYLPPAIVTTLYRDLEMDDEWIGKGNREDQTIPVLHLRSSATTLGLLRKARGKLTITAAGAKLVDDPDALLRHIASRIPLGKPHEKDAGLVALLITAAGDDLYRSRSLAARIMDGIGWRVQGDQLDLAAYHWADPTMDVLKGLAGWLNKALPDLAARALLRRP
ncbi:MAG: plasmid pRiA4b ORF-3 family protein [Micropruina sp.]|uniref:plasmid pRiA4b ORF-3 family protein n=1 Tax=Micropruina sp. TaxID=2737536 RepID=UPI0039E3A426